MRAEQDLRAALAALTTGLGRAQADLDRAQGLADALTQAFAERRQPFAGHMTVHAAWARHPGVAGIFAGHHLPACPDCAVGADETLAEAAYGYGLDLGALLGQLNALLETPGA